MFHNHVVKIVILRKIQCLRNSKRISEEEVRLGLSMKVIISLPVNLKNMGAFLTGDNLEKN